MKRITVFLLFSVFMANYGLSQDFLRIKEIGLFTSDLNSFGIRCKTGTDDLMYRFSAFSLSLSSAEYDFGNGIAQDEDEFGLGLAGGIEKPVSLNERFDLFYGGELSLQYKNSDVVDEEEVSKRKFGSWGLGVVLGCSYYISPKFKLSVEVIPGLTHIRVKEGDLDVTGWKFEVSNQNAGITLSYRF